MANPLNQPNLLYNTGEGVIHAGNSVSLRIEEGGSGSGKNVPVLSTEKPIPMPPGKAIRLRVWPEALPGYCASWHPIKSENNRYKFNMERKRIKGGGEYPVNSTHSTFLSTKIQMEKKNHEIK